MACPGGRWVSGLRFQVSIRKSLSSSGYGADSAAHYPFVLLLYDALYYLFVFADGRGTKPDAKGRGTSLSAQPNLHGIGRFFYTLVGAILIGYGFFGVEAQWAHYLLPSLGGVFLVEGLIGYSVVAAAMGIRKRGVK